MTWCLPAVGCSHPTARSTPAGCRWRTAGSTPSAPASDPMRLSTWAATGWCRVLSTCTATAAAVGRSPATTRAWPSRRTAGTAPPPPCASLVSRPIKELARQIEALGDLVRGGDVAGIHLEGPFLSAARCGAHDPRVLRPPDRDSVRKLLDAGDGKIRMVTLAPELDGAIDAIREFTDTGSSSRSATPTPPRHRSAPPSTRARPWPRTCSTACARCTTASPARSARCSTTSGSASS